MKGFQKGELRESPIQKGGINGSPTNPAPIEFRPKSPPSKTKPFPIQADEKYPRCTVPWWLVEIAYEYYSKQYGTSQSLERLAERGGFGGIELIHLIRQERIV